MQTEMPTSPLGKYELRRIDRNSAEGASTRIEFMGRAYDVRPQRDGTLVLMWLNHRQGINDWYPLAASRSALDLLRIIGIEY
jgi:hypothetical protein